MKRQSFVSAVALGLALSAGSAFAADLPSRKAPPQVFLPPPPLWTGFYAGLNAGYAWGANSNVGVGTTQAYDFFGSNSIRSLFGSGPTTSLDPKARLSAVSASGTANVQDSGFIGGAQIGYNYQWDSRFVIGFEADIQGADIRGENGFIGGNAWNVVNANIPFKYYHQKGVLNVQFNRSAATTTDVTKSTDWLGTVRGRFGFLATPTLLLFGTGGLAYGGVEARVQQFQTINNTFSAQFNPPNGPGAALNIPGSAFGVTRYSDTRVGWTAGGGVEWMFMPSWSLKAEGLYYDLGTAAIANSPLVTAGPTLAFAGNLAGLNARVPFMGTINQSVTRVQYDGVIARAGLNYHFNFEPGAVVARY
jgi:outer membrane immunogenic protein